MGHNCDDVGVDDGDNFAFYVKVCITAAHAGVFMIFSLCSSRWQGLGLRRMQSHNFRVQKGRRRAFVEKVVDDEVHVSGDHSANAEYFCLTLFTFISSIYMCNYSPLEVILHMTSCAHSLSSLNRNVCAQLE